MKPRLLVKPGVFSNRPPQAETAAFLARCAVLSDYQALTASGRAAWAQAIDNFVVAGKAHGWFAKLDALYVLAAPSQSVSYLNLISSSFTLVEHNDGSDTLTFMPSYGYIGNSTAAGYLDTQMVLGTATQATLHDHVVGCYSPGTLNDTGWAVASSGGANIALQIRNSRYFAYRDCNSSTVQVLANSAKGSRQLNTTGGVTTIGVSSTYTTFTDSAATLPSSTVRLFRFGTGVTYSDSQLSMVWIGKGYTADQLSYMYADVVACLVAIGAIDNDDPPAPEVLGSNFWERRYSDYIAPTMRFSYGGTPPTNNPSQYDKSFVGWPCNQIHYGESASATAASSTLTSIPMGPMVWIYRKSWPVGNAGGYNTKPNPAQRTGIVMSSGLEARFTFSTYDKAFGAQIASCMYSNGFSARADASNTGTWAGLSTRFPQLAAGQGYLDVLDAFGFTTADSLDSGDVYSYAYATASTAHADAIFNGTFSSYAVSLDKFVLPAGRVCDIAGGWGQLYIVDAESADGRTAAQTLSLHEELGRLTHLKGRRFIVYNDYVYGVACAKGGMDATSFPQHNRSPYINAASIQVWPGYPSSTIPSQLAIFNDGVHSVDYSKIQIVAGIGPYQQELSLADCQVINTAVRNYGLYGVQIWNDLGVPGGASTRRFNQDIAALAGIDINALPADPVYGSEADALNTAAGGGIPSATLVAYQTWVDTLKAQGSWTLADARWFPALDTSVQTIELMTNTSTILAMGGILYNPNQGWQGDGSSMWLDPQWATSGSTQYQKDACHLAAYVFGGTTRTNEVMGFTGGSSSELRIDSPTAAKGRLNTAAGTATLPSSGAYGGFLAVVRTSSSAIFGCRGGTTNDISEASSALGTQGMGILRFGKTGTTYGDMTFAYGSVGGTMTKAQMLGEEAALETLIATLGLG